MAVIRGFRHVNQVVAGEARYCRGRREEPESGPRGDAPDFHAGEVEAVQTLAGLWGRKAVSGRCQGWFCWRRGRGDGLRMLRIYLDKHKKDEAKRILTSMTMRVVC